MPMNCPNFPHGEDDVHAPECPLCDGSNSVQWAFDALDSDIADARSQGDSERAAYLTTRRDALLRSLTRWARDDARTLLETLADAQEGSES